jgi:hypothetical protein
MPNTCSQFHEVAAELTGSSVNLLMGLFCSALGPKLNPLFTWMDLLLTVGEFGCESTASNNFFIFHECG